MFARRSLGSPLARIVLGFSLLLASGGPVTVLAQASPAATAAPPSPHSRSTPTPTVATPTSGGTVARPSANVAPQATSGPVTVTVTATQGWVSTGLLVNAGDTISVTASGSWRPGASWPVVGPDGEVSPWRDNFLNLTDVGNSIATTDTPHFAALIGYIGNNPPPFGSYTNPSILPDAQRVFLLGSNVTTSAAFQGPLWLNFNDDAYSGNTSDNSGSVTATVSVTFSTSTTLGDTSPYKGYTPDPVDTSTGNATYRHTDISIAGRGGGVVFARFYNSADTRPRARSVQAGPTPTTCTSSTTAQAPRLSVVTAAPTPSGCRGQIT